MNFDIGVASKSSQNSDGSSFYDELMNFDSLLSCSTFNLTLPEKNYASQLRLRRKTQANTDDDSGLNFESTVSGVQENTQREFQFFGNEKAASIQNTVGASTFNSDESQISTTINFRQTSDFSACFSHSQSISAERSNDSIKGSSDNDNVFIDEEMPLSTVAENTSDDEETQPSSLTTNPTDCTLLEIESILKLYTKIRSQYSDCAFVHALAANMCKDIYPKGSHVSLKIALLLSIISCNAQEDAQPISIMAIARDSAAASAIMQNIGHCAKRFISVSDDLKFNGKSVKSTAIEPNSLLLAHNGIFHIGDWLELKATSLDYLKSGILLLALSYCVLIMFYGHCDKVLDRGRVNDASSNIEYALNCAIWMYWTSSAKKMGQNEKDLSVISMLFGIPVVLDEVPSEDVISSLFAQCASMQTECERDEGDEIDDRAMKTYLQFVSKIPTQFEEEAMAMLKYYFIVTRAVRPNILSAKSFDILKRLSECHAKLCLRSDVLKIDVIFSIELFEEFVLNTFAGQMATKPIPNSSQKNLQQVDDNMHEFAEWLNTYLSNINENVLTLFQESA